MRKLRENSSYRDIERVKDRVRRRFARYSNPETQRRKQVKGQRYTKRRHKGMIDHSNHLTQMYCKVDCPNILEYTVNNLVPSPNNSASTMTIKAEAPQISLACTAELLQSNICSKMPIKDPFTEDYCLSSETSNKCLDT